MGRAGWLALGASVLLLVPPRSSRADEWDKAIDNAKGKEAANETDEERARRKEREEREKLAIVPQDPSRFFVFAGLGAVHHESSSLLKDPAAGTL